MILPIQPQKQLLTFWCWAAITSTVSHFYEPDTIWTQGQLATDLLNSPCSNIVAGNTITAIDACNKEFDITKALQKSGNYAGIFTRPLKLDETISQINGGFPICCQIEWVGFSDFHFVLIYGYDGDNLIIADPDPEIDAGITVNYNTFKTNYRSGGQWRKSIGTQAAAS